MTARELENIVWEFNEYYMQSPAMQAVHFGCECGCGGDSYTNESWDDVHQAGDDAYDVYFQFCDLHKIKWDYPTK